MKEATPKKRKGARKKTKKPGPGYTSRWVVDRKWFGGERWMLRYTSCNNAYCQQGCPGPVHGPYWMVQVIIDGRNLWRRRDPPWVTGDVPEPPSLRPSEEDPDSRQSKRRAARAARGEATASPRKKRRTPRDRQLTLVE